MGYIKTDLEKIVELLSPVIYYRDFK